MIKILDTNFLCSFFDLLDSNHEKAKAVFFDQLGEDELKVPYVVAAELLVNDMSAKYFPAVTAITNRYVKNNEADLEFISGLPGKLKRKLKANDCLILALCKRYNAELISFDKNLIIAKKLLM